MFLVVFKKEILIQLLNYRFILMFALVLVFATSTIIIRYEKHQLRSAGTRAEKKLSDRMTDNYLELTSSRASRLKPKYPFMDNFQLEEVARDRVREVRWSYFWNVGIHQVRDVLPHRFFIEGLSDILPRKVQHSFMAGTLFSYDDPEFVVNKESMPDFLFVMVTVFSLLALMMSYDALCGEKEDGTLKLELSSPLSRAKLLLAKYSSGVFLMALAIAFIYLVIFLYLIGIKEVQMNGEEWAHYFFQYIFALIYVSVFFAIGLLVSAMNQRKSTSLMFALFVWVLLVFIWPNLSIVLGRALSPTPTYHKVKAEVESMEKDRHFKLRRLRRSGIETHTEEYQDAERKFQSEMESQKRDLWRMYKRTQDRQIALATNLGRISPAMSYTLIATEFSGTGLQAFYEYFEKLQRFQNKFEEHFKSLKRKYGNHLQNVKSGWLVREEMANLRISKIEVGEALQHSAMDISLLLFECMFIFMLAYVKFIHYEV